MLNIESELFFHFCVNKNKNYITLWRPNKRVYKYLNIFIINESRVAYDNFMNSPSTWFIPLFLYYIWIKKHNLKSYFEL